MREKAARDAHQVDECRRQSRVITAPEPDMAMPAGSFYPCLTILHLTASNDGLEAPMCQSVFFNKIVESQLKQKICFM